MIPKNERKYQRRPVSKSLKEYGRGIAGGLLFSFPLLFTMEVWWFGFSATALQLFVLIMVTYLLLLGYNRFAGMRANTSWRSVMIDSVEEMGIGIILSFVVLVLLHRIEAGITPLDEAMGKTIVEAMAVSIGVSVGTAQLGASPAEESEGNEEEKGQNEVELTAEKQTRNSWWADKLSLVVLALCGAIIIGGNVAPTEEVVELAVEAKPEHIFWMAVASLGISMVVMYFSDFKGAARHAPKHVAYGIIFDTSLCYLTALVASGMCLWFFGRFQGVSFYVAFSECVVLGVISSLGASAGRLLIK